ncbi:hypothetical protein [Caldimonas tepidiphila]|uniref:hypothetical protein n=1 Tax=Caldimonas tepidiphila TaxID=2315841 RepID=UPI0013001E29|nr:hypothetical protein [Caldimonas tepidiphila]
MQEGFLGDGLMAELSCWSIEDIITVKMMNVEDEFSAAFWRVGVNGSGIISMKIEDHDE